jgi:hypothetical protein
MGSGFKTFTAGAVLTASDVNNYLQEQSVMYFATTAARDSALSASLEDGLVAYIGSNDENEGLYTYNGTSWRRGPGWNAPWGYSTFLQNTSTGTQNMVSSTVVTGLTGTVALVANRRYKATFQINQSGTSVLGQYAIQDNGVVVGSTWVSVVTAGTTPITFTGVIYFTSAATSSRTVRLVGTSAVGTATLNVDTVIRQSLLIEDIGPSGAPV